MAKVEYHRYANLSRLSAQIYLGGYADAMHTDLLRFAGITAICNLTNTDLGTQALGFPTLVLGQEDGESISRETLDTFFAWMLEHVAQQHVILVHCAAGISRTPSFVIAWFLWLDAANAETGDVREMWSTHEDRIRRYRPVIQPHHRLKDSVLRYFGWTPFGEMAEYTGEDTPVDEA
jgi:hypothetical protein